MGVAHNPIYERVILITRFSFISLLNSGNCKILENATIGCGITSKIIKYKQPNTKNKFRRQSDHQNRTKQSFCKKRMNNSVKYKLVLRLKESYF